MDNQDIFSSDILLHCCEIIAFLSKNVQIFKDNQRIYNKFNDRKPSSGEKIFIVSLFKFNWRWIVESFLYSPQVKISIYLKNLIWINMPQLD